MTTNESSKQDPQTMLNTAPQSVSGTASQKDTAAEARAYYHLYDTQRTEEGEIPMRRDPGSHLPLGNATTLVSEPKKVD